MRYFMMKEDTMYANRPEILNWTKIIEARDLYKRDFSKIPKRIILEIKPNKDTDFLDIITLPFLLVSKKVYKLLQEFEPNLQYKEIILLDKKYGKAEEYFLPLIKTISCLTEKTEFNLDHSVLKRVFINRKKIGDKCIFAFDEGPKNLIVIRLDVAESILRRNRYGFMLTEVEYDLEKEV
jgi:hypothetical protein